MNQTLLKFVGQIMEHIGPAQEPLQEFHPKTKTPVSDIFFAIYAIIMLFTQIGVLIWLHKQK